MLNFFEADRMCFEYIANIFAESDAENGQFYANTI